MSASTLEKTDRKIIEKNRRNQMKCLYARLFSLIPPHGTSKGGDHMVDQVDRTIDYIKTLKTSLEMSKNKKDKLLSTILLNIQVHEMTQDHDAVLVTGLQTHSSFSNVVQFLDQYSAEVTFANFSSNGHSIFHIRQKKIDADDICKRLKNLVGNMKELGDNTYASFSNEIFDLDLSEWIFDFLN